MDSKCKGLWSSSEQKKSFFVGSKDDIGLSDDDAPAKTSRRKFKIAKDVLDLKVDENIIFQKKLKKL